jgi:TRAP-type C4-dicarboxylate transport system substrate-binding protein
MRKTQLLVVIICLLLSMIVVIPGLSCAKETPTATPTTQPTATPTTQPTETAKPITVTVNDHNPAESTVAKAWDDWGAWVEQQSGGRLDINIIHGGALLANDAEAWQGTKDGVCDIAHYVVDSEQGFQLSLVMALPFMGWKEQHVEDAYWTLMNEFPAMANEWSDVKILSAMMMPPTQLHTIDKVVVTPNDIKGMRFIGAEAMTIKALAVAGATVADVPIPEMTTSLMTGLADGVINHFPVCGIFGALDVLKCHTVFGDGGINMTPMFAIMNKNFFNGLPADLQQVLIDSGPKWLEFQTSWDKISMDNAMTMCEGHTFTNLTPEEITVWRDLVKEPIHDEWIAQSEAVGLPGQAVYERAVELAAAN